MLDPVLNRIVLSLAPRHVASARAPETYRAIVDAHGQRGDILVWDGASDCTIFGDARVNHAFRAWHDFHHIAGAHDFTLAGEIATMRAQQRDLFAHIGWNECTRRIARIIEAEVQGQAEYFAAHGEFPADQIAFTKEHLA